MNKVLRAAIRTMSRHQGDMTKDYEKSRKKEKMYPVRSWINYLLITLISGVYNSATTQNKRSEQDIHRTVRWAIRKGETND